MSAMLPFRTRNLNTPPTRQVTTLQPTRAVVSRFTRQPVRPLAGTSHLNTSKLTAAASPTVAIRAPLSRQAK